MDLLGAWRAFVNVSEHGSFTEGAAATRIPQSVASRRIAALERHLGERLLDRSSRRVTLTRFGRDLLPSAKRLVRLAEAMEDEAERARLSPLRLAVPGVCSVRDLAVLAAEARRKDVYLDFHPAPPAERAELVRSREVRAALTATPPDDGAWSVRLGLAGAAAPAARTLYLETLRAGRTGLSARPRRIWIQPEDDVPHVRDRLFRVRDAVGLLPAQVAVARTLVVAAAEVLATDDLLLCSPRQAAELGLHWRPIGDVRVGRGFDVAAAIGDDAERVRTRLREEIGRCLGTDETEGGPAR
ncbi:LysR family transcriptional regulator [Actinoallomurus spadix]|uniref:LysR family transcriptional regulator n=1 Tax=Actinoallomurus spadix TaxID=79912 RepID=A0ABP3FYH4_9ACTN|nr:LysR family transcriptional regulator [Actinoallomurus spadix]MCO5989194.1 LysR family transcriptional regulator [Actinoallomurus spadix]